MLSIVITSFKEPHLIGRAIESIVNQKIPEKYELVISAPDKPTLDVARKYSKKHKQIKVFQDPGKGKVFALNLLLPKLKGEIIILTDGDVFLSKNSIQSILRPFKDKKVGCVSGKPISINPRNTILGYWSHLLCNAADNLRRERQKKNQFLECSGYLWAFRNKVIKEIPPDTAEDSIVPYFFYERGYKIKYIPEAEVNVKFPTNLRDFVDQKVRTAKAHETLKNFTDTKKIPRMKTFKNEIFGAFKIFKFAENFREFLYTLILFPVRFYIWMKVFFRRYIKRDLKVDGWAPTKSTKEV